MHVDDTQRKLQVSTKHVYIHDIFDIEMKLVKGSYLFGGYGVSIEKPS